MKFIKTYIGALIISFGLLFVIGSALMAMGIGLPSLLAGRLLETWLLLALILYPFARKIVRV